MEWINKVKLVLKKGVGGYINEEGEWEDDLATFLTRLVLLIISFDQVGGAPNLLTSKLGGSTPI